MGTPSSGRAPGDVIIRTAVVDDIPQLGSFLCANEGEPWTLAPEVIVQIEVPVWVVRAEAVVLVAERADVVVGVIAMTPQPDRKSTRLNSSH